LSQAFEFPESSEGRSRSPVLEVESIRLIEAFDDADARAIESRNRCFQAARLHLTAFYASLLF
jgi:hypothetical protein